MRSDAVKNRQRLLVAAGQVFEEKGLGASVTDVARAAGVGMGTLYRRFASKEALIEALVSEVLEETIVDDDLHLDLGDERHLVLGAPVDLRVAPLATEALGFGQRGTVRSVPL